MPSSTATTETFLAVEIGGTKLQLAAGSADGLPLRECQRLDVNPAAGAAGILEQIESHLPDLIRRHHPSRLGIGFGGPVDSTTGRVLKSHQIGGWESVPLADWCVRTFGLDTVVGNDCDLAALAEARFGAGRGRSPVFYVTVGTGVGGGLVMGSRLHGAGRPAVAEIGHLRPGPQAESPDDTVESRASGWGIAAQAAGRLTGDVSRPLYHVRREKGLDRDGWRRRLAELAQTDREYAADLLARCDHQIDSLTAKIVAQAAADGNEIAREVLDQALQVLGWAIAQTITLVAPQVVVVGGGVSLIGEQAFFVPLRQYVRRYVFPPLLDSYEILPAQLGEEVVLYGAIALASQD